MQDTARKCNAWHDINCGSAFKLRWTFLNKDCCLEFGPALIFGNWSCSATSTSPLICVSSSLFSTHLYVSLIFVACHYSTDSCQFPPIYLPGLYIALPSQGYKRFLHHLQSVLLVKDFWFIALFFPHGRLLIAVIWASLSLKLYADMLCYIYM